MILAGCAVCCIGLWGCQNNNDGPGAHQDVLRGYTQVLEVETDGRRVKFVPIANGQLTKPMGLGLDYDAAVNQFIHGFLK